MVKEMIKHVCNEKMDETFERVSEIQTMTIIKQPILILNLFVPCLHKIKSF